MNPLKTTSIKILNSVDVAVDTITTASVLAGDTVLFTLHSVRTLAAEELGVTEENIKSTQKLVDLMRK